MELLFLGRGAGFNPNEGSTSAYFITNDEMFLIDSGESIFRTLLNLKLLNSVTALNLLITHTHSDHVGSLGSLVLYAYAVKKIPVNIIIDENMQYLPNIRTLLTIYGITEKMYRFVDASELEGKYRLFDKVCYVKTVHCDELESCGILFETKQGIVFYSGDMNETAPLVDLFNSGCKVDKVYIDSNNDRKPNLHHISIHQVNDIVTPELRPKIYCMHLPTNPDCESEARAYGFNVITVSA
jgi:ribonuclease BN (tRNA processing enzyme)